MAGSSGGGGANNDQNLTDNQPTTANADNKEHVVETGRPEKKNKPKVIILELIPVHSRLNFAESKFHQQRLPAWQPILTAGTVIPSFLVVGLAFIPIGGLLLWVSENTKEHSVDYTFCTRKGGNGTETCSDWLRSNLHRANYNDKCECDLLITLEDDFHGEVFFFYGLDNFYQNHRRYVKSRNDEQLTGKLDQTTDCSPFDKLADGRLIAPCGAVANSMFNGSFTGRNLAPFPTADTFKLYENSSNKKVPMDYKGVAWPVDTERKFKNPPGNLTIAFDGYAKPPNWRKHAWELDPNNPENNGFRNVDFMVWMRTAALPNFRKLYRKLDKSWHNAGLFKGNYTLVIEYEYPVTQFEGGKRFIISTQSWLGSKNNFLGVAYIVVGVLCFILSVVFFVVHRQFGHGLSDMAAVRGDGQNAVQ